MELYNAISFSGQFPDDYRCIHTAASDSSTTHNHRTDGGHRLAPSPGTDDHGKHEMVSEFDNRTHIWVQVDTHSKQIPRSFGSTPSLNKDVHNAALCCYPSYSYHELSSTANNPQRYRPAWRLRESDERGGSQVEARSNDQYFTLCLSLWVLKMTLKWDYHREIAGRYE